MSERLQHTEPIQDTRIQHFSEGKTHIGNDDLIVLQNNAITVIDGATAAVPFSVDGMTSGTYAAHILQGIVLDLPEKMFGYQWAEEVSRLYNEILFRSPVAELIAAQPEARPCASIVHSFFCENNLYITQVGDVAFRLNGAHIYRNDKQIDHLHAAIRQKVMKRQEEIKPDINIEALLVDGRKAIQPLITLQRKLYQNKAVLMGYGVIDGMPIPEALIKTYIFPLDKIDTLEIFTDGYFEAAEEPTLQSWEESFERVEEQDPYKYLKYPSTKGSIPGKQYTDDRSIVIWKRD